MKDKRMCVSGRSLTRIYLAAAVVLSLLLAVARGSGAELLLVEDFSVVDGDTLQIGDKVYNLYGVDAPELGQRCLQDGRWLHCGLMAAFELKKMLDFEKPLRCELASENTNRLVCHASGVDVAQVLLKSGYGVAAPGSSAPYKDAELSAKMGNLGLWHMSFVAPWDWRHGRRLPGLEAESEGDCPIKAIIAPDGTKRYYVPTDKDYADVTVDPAKGERRFCSNAAARMAGWRRPGEAG